jgi:hypothetical protein
MIRTVFLKVDRASLRIRQTPVVKDLQQHVKDVRMRFLDLVKQDDRVRTPAHSFRQLSAFLVTRRNPGGAPIMRATACFSMYSDMSRRIIARSSSNKNSANARAVSVLPTPVGPKEDERADRAIRILQAGAGASDGIGDRGKRLFLTDQRDPPGVSPSSPASAFRPSSIRETGMPVHLATI